MINKGLRSDFLDDSSKLKKRHPEVMQTTGIRDAGLASGESGTPTRVPEGGTPDRYFDSRANRQILAFARLYIRLWSVKEQTYREKFDALKEEWRKETLFLSSTHEICMHEAYQKIIGIGPPAVPLIMNELRDQPDHWFWALRSITGTNPVPERERGNLEAMAERWLEWGNRHGLTLENISTTTVKPQDVESGASVPAVETDTLRSHESGNSSV